MPVVILRNFSPGNHDRHAAVLQENTIWRTRSGANRYVKIKNTNTNEPTINARLDMIPNLNGWALAGPKCMYIEFA